MTMSQVCWHADLQSMYRLCKSLYTAGFAQGTNTHFLSQRRDLYSNLEIIQGPAERPRIMKRWPKTQEDTSPKNILRSVHRLSLGPHIRAWSLGAYQFFAQTKCKQVGSYSVIAKKAMLGSDSGIISLLPSLPKPKMLRLCKSHRLKKNSIPKTSTTALWNIWSVCCLCSHQLNWLQLTLNQPRKNTRNLSQTTLVRTENAWPTYQTWCWRLFGCICLRNLPSLVWLAHLYLTPSTFENSTFLLQF
jgi:hypothetical protein